MRYKVRFVSWLLLVAAMVFPVTVSASEEPPAYTTEASAEILAEEPTTEVVSGDGTNMAAVAEGTGASPVSSMNRWEWELVVLTNRERVKAGLYPLTVSDTSQTAAHTRAAELANDYGPKRPNGTNASTVLGNLSWSAFVENIDMGGTKVYPADVLSTWMDNAELKSYILHTAIMHIGTGYTYNAVSAKNGQRFGYEPENYWEQLLYAVSGETYTGISMDSLSVESGTEIDDMGGILKATASTGASYWLPLMEEFCTGYDVNTIEKQEITVSALGKTTTATVYVMPVVSGDLNGDELVDLVDLVRLMKAVAAGSRVLPGDMDADGDMDAADLVRMAKHLSGDAAVLEGKYPTK